MTQSRKKMEPQWNWEMSAGLRPMLMVVLRRMEVSRLPVLLKKSMVPNPGSKDAEPLNGGLPPPGSIHAAGSWMAPAQADAASHTSIPHVAIKRLMNILRRLSDAAHFSYGYRSEEHTSELQS